MSKLEEQFWALQPSYTRGLVVGPSFSVVVLLRPVMPLML